MVDNIPASSALVNYWDGAVSNKEFGHPLPQSVVEEYFPPGGTVLDAGCGYGRLSMKLADLGFVVSGADISPVMLKQAQKNVPSGDFRCYQNELTWKENTFDVAILVTLLTSVPLASDQRQIVNEIKRVLKPGGYLFVSDMPLQWSSRYTGRYAEGLEKYGEYGVFDLSDGGTVRHHDRGYFMQLMSGFICLGLESHSVTTMNNNQAQAFRYIGQLTACQEG